MTQTGHCLQILRGDENGKTEDAKFITPRQENSSILKNNFILKERLFHKVLFYA